MSRKSGHLLLIRMLHIIVAIAIIYSAVVAVIMILQYRQIEQVHILEFDELNQLKEDLKRDQKNQKLRERIRQLDFLARKVWFGTKEQLNIGKYLLASGVTVLILCLGLVKILKGPQRGGRREDFQAEKNANIEFISVSALGGMTMVATLLLYFWVSPDSVLQRGDKDPSGAARRRVLNDVSLADFESNWPNFRGPRGLGVGMRHKLVVDFDGASGGGIKWRQKIPLPGFSSVIVWEGQLFVTAGDARERAVFSYDAFSGQLLWKHSTDGDSSLSGKLPKVSPDTGFAASTPATDGNHVYAIFATGELVCSDLAGNRIWSKSLGIPENHYGYSSSLLAMPGSVLVQFYGGKRQVLYLIEGSTGRVIWEKNRNSSISWSSPIHVQAGSLNLLIICTSKAVEAYQVENGKLVWSVDCMGGEMVPSATFSDGVVMVANDNARTVGIDILTGKLLWKNEEAVQPDVSSPIAYKNMGFLFSSSGTITCLDLQTGKMLWEKDLDQGFYSSPLLIEDRIAVFNMDGRMHVLRPDREALVIEKGFDLGTEVVTTPAFAGNHMWIRSKDSIYCIQNQEGKK